jgi:hypothetical protein
MDHLQRQQQCSQSRQGGMVSGRKQNPRFLVSCSLTSFAPLNARSGGQLAEAATREEPEPTKHC